MRIAIIGAGVAGLTTAKVLRQVGHEVVVFDKTPDVGGVWSRTRRYPGVTTQSAKDTYAFSDFPMPKDFPEWPSGEQVQSYLQAYATHFELDPLLRLETEVISARPRGDGHGWTVDVRSAAGGAQTSADFDHLVVANGVFSEPFLPAYEGVDDFTSAGGRVLAASDFHEVADAAGRRVVVVGYGKSACDVAKEISDVAASTSVIARQLLWKVPKKIGGVLNFKYLLLTRMGEALFRFQHLRGAERFLHGPGNGLRRRMLSSVGTVTKRQYDWEKLGLVPAGTMEDIVRNAIGLVTDGFYERVADGRISVHRDQIILRLLDINGTPQVELSDGTHLPADLLVCATGYRQGLPFFEPALQDRLMDERGNFMLYRQVHPIDVPNLSFAGYNSSFFSPLNAEMAAVWIAALLGGVITLPPSEELRMQVTDRLAFMDRATNGHHSHGTKIIPFSMHNVDEVLNDIGLNIGARTRALHWLGPVDPGAYGQVAEKLQGRLAMVERGDGQAAGITDREPAAAS